MICNVNTIAMSTVKKLPLVSHSITTTKRLNCHNDLHSFHDPIMMNKLYYSNKGGDRFRRKLQSRKVHVEQVTLSRKTRLQNYKC